MFSDTQELGNFGMMVLGIDPAKSTADDWQQAADKLKEQKERRHRPQLLRPELHRRARQGRGLDHPGLVRRHLPEERLRRHELQVRRSRRRAARSGPTTSTIPITAANPVDAITLMDFFYDVEIAATLAEYINYVYAGAGRAGADQAGRGQGVRRGQGGPGGGGGRARWSSRPRPDYAKLHYYRDFATVGRAAGVPAHLRADRAGLTVDEPVTRRVLAPVPAGLAGRAVAAAVLRRADGDDAVAVAAGGRHRQRATSSPATGRPTWTRSATTRTQFVRSLIYGAITTVVLIVLAFPVAYWIAFYGGRRKSHLPVPAAAAVLRLVRAAHHLVAAHPHRRGHRCSARSRTSGLLPAGLPHPRHAVRGDRRPGLQLPAVHGAADLRGPGADRPAGGRGGPRPVRRPGHRVPQGDLPAGAARGVRRRADDLRAGQLRLRQLGRAGQLGDHDDRPGHPGAVPDQLRTIRPPRRCRSR